MYSFYCVWMYQLFSNIHKWFGNCGLFLNETLNFYLLLGIFGFHTRSRSILLLSSPIIINFQTSRSESARSTPGPAPVRSEPDGPSETVKTGELSLLSAVLLFCYYCTGEVYRYWLV